MPMLELTADDAIYYEWMPPANEQAASFVFVNPITGDVGMWNAAIVPALQEAGFGTLVYNFRGQAKSRFATGTALDDRLLVTDLIKLVRHVHPPRAVLAGLSIGGLYAARAALAGVEVSGVVLINTLRRITTRIAGMNDASLRVMQLGGANLMKDLYFHLLVGEPFQQAHRKEFLLETPNYEPLPEDSGAHNLLTWMGKSDWDVDWSGLQMPTLVVTGLQDRVFYDAGIVEQLFATLPNAQRLDVPEAGHMLPVETPEVLIEAMKRFGAEL